MNESRMDPDFYIQLSQDYSYQTNAISGRDENEMMAKAWLWYI